MFTACLHFAVCYLVIVGAGHRRKAPMNGTAESLEFPFIARHFDDIIMTNRVDLGPKKK